MAPTATEEMMSNDHELLHAHDELWHQSLSYLKSLALAVALDLGIPDAIHRHGGSGSGGGGGGATLPQILAGTAVHPSKLRALGRLMRVLTVASGTLFTVHEHDDGEADAAAAVYRLTAASRFLVSDAAAAAAGGGEVMTSLAPFMSVVLHPIRVSPHAVGMCAWFRQEHHDPSIFGLAFRQIPTIWGHADDANAMLNRGLAAQSRFLTPLMLRECGDAVFRGVVGSLVDVGGGHGGAATAIAAAFPHLKCTVLDLPHVVASAPTTSSVHFVAGDMFQSIPSATAVFLKTTLHDWGDDECVKILKNCKQAIPPRDAGGKVIIMDMVVGHGKSNIVKHHLETQVMFDLFIMTVNGIERDEQEWKKIFIQAGFEDYKILPVVGTLSVIEVYP